MRLHDLPDDVLIAILSLVDLHTLISLRLAAKATQTVIDTYIRTIAPAVARTTFPLYFIDLHKPKDGHHSLQWLRNLIPQHLAAIVVDKDKLRRHCYINSGFPYGIPYECMHTKAMLYRNRIANGWRVLRSLHLISVDIYEKDIDELEKGRPKVLRKFSGGVRKSRVWQTVSCQYLGCEEHGLRHLFDHNHTKKTPNLNSDNYYYERERRPSSVGHTIEEVRFRESLILKRRLKFLDSLSNQDLLDYTYVWRLLLWVFRPYRKPGTRKPEGMGNSGVNWQVEISSISQGCSWLIWLVLHIGTEPFWTQWSTSSNSKNRQQQHLRDTIWRAVSERSPHQIELERTFITKFEFALRKRCLGPAKAARIEAELLKGRTVKTVSLDCIGWKYDQHPIVERRREDFPWYKVGSWIWMDGDSWFFVGGEGMGSDLVWSIGNPNDGDQFGINDEDHNDQDGRGCLSDVPYLVYLGVEDGEKVWGTSRTEMAMVF